MGSLNVLLIEDNEAHAKIISRYLSRDEFNNNKVIHEEFLQSGLQRIGKENYDIILLDLRLPDSGIDETLKKTLQIAVDIPIVVLSSLEDRKLAIRSVHEGAQDYLCKTNLSTDILFRTMANAIERKQNEKRIRQQLNLNTALYECSHLALEENDISRVIDFFEKKLKYALQLDFIQICEFLPALAAELNIKTPEEMGPERVWIAEKPERLSFFAERGLRSGLNAFLIDKHSAQKPRLLMAYSKRSEAFSVEQISFFKSIVNTLTESIIKRRLETELNQKVVDLKEAHRRKDEFLATLSHELRSPLYTIANSLELLADYEGRDPFLKEIFEIIKRNVHMETKLISEILDMSRIITGKMKVEVSEFDFLDILNNTLDAVRPGIDAKQIRLELKIEGNLHSVIGDRDRLRQVVWNLLSNAVKFTGKKGAIDILVRKTEAQLEFSIQDTGIGFAPENSDLVFEKFWQEDAGLNRKHSGLGLGLGIVKQIVELHGGNVKANSQGKDRGAAFEFNLPMRQALALKEHSSPAEIASPAIGLRPQDGQVLQGVRILLVDDAEDNVVLLKRLLEKKGAAVDGKNLPKEGLLCAQTQKYDVLISDIGMPEMDGHELMRKLREWERQQMKSQLPAIALTAFASAEDAEAALGCGYQVHMGKPASIPLLVKEILNLAKP